MILFECKIKYQKIDQNGKDRIVSENYLLDAISFSDAETRIHKEMEPYITGEFSVVAIKLSNINDVIESDGETMYRVVVEFISLDEEKGVEKKAKHRMLVNADSVEMAYKNTENWLSDTLSDYSIKGVVDSNLIDYFPI